MAAAAGPDGDDRTFKVDFTDTGEKLLQELLRKKLREFMSAPDDIVEYVILLLRGGVCRNDACQKLDVFLEDDSASFISWLWDHLSTHLHLYVKVQEQNQQQNDDVEAPKEASARPMPSEVLQTSKIQIHSEHTIESSTSTRKQNHREWKGTGWEGNEKFPLRSVLTDILHGEKKRSQKSNEIWHPPLKQQNGRKRDRDDEPQQTKRVLSSRPMLGGGGGASCRLLQFAVRDAVKAVQPANSSAEPASKRLRSLVSAAPADNLRDKKSERSQDCLNDRRSERTRPVLQVQGAALALKAAADSTKVRSTGSVFKRLGQGNVVKQPSHSREEKRDYRDFEPVTAVDELDSDRYGNDEDSEVESGELNMADREAEMSVDSTYDDDLDRDEHITRYQSSGSHEVAFDSVVEKKAILVKCSIEPEMQAIRPSSVINKEQPISSLTGAARKTVVVPAVASTAEPIDYETPKDVHVVKKPNVAPTNANATSLHSNVKEVGHVEIQKDSQRSAPSVSYNTTHPSEDADSRTLYVTNVHFAATKDSLSRHFNKFGAVLKVVIVTNAATGQPTGSAYIEFLHKESAERALSLNGTSFMTRILKVVRRSSHESAQFYGWPGSGRSSLYGRHGRMYPRAVLPGSSFRGRTPMKIGARSLQWKREPSCTDSSAGAKHDMSVPLSSEQVLPPGT